jgi:hypothetical protein
VCPPSLECTSQIQLSFGGFKGLALFSDTGTVAYGDNGGDINDGANSVTGAIYDANNSVTINTNQDVLALTTGGGNQTTTPPPGALPLFASAGGLLGLFDWRRKRKQAGTTA